jgi:hypothetical protein
MTKNKGLMTLTPGAVDSADPNGDVIKGLLDMLPDWLQLLAVAAPWSVELEYNELKNFVSLNMSSMWMVGGKKGLFCA